ncbi:MAG: IclR family transcriptional regulator [Ornithinimicrobium sp.]
MRQPESPLDSSPSSVGGTQAVDRAAALIDLVIHSDVALSSTELSDASGLARSTTSRLLTALERTQLLERRIDGLYVGGQLFALYAALHDPWPQMARVAEPVLQTVGQECGETVHLGIARSDNVFYVAQVESTYLLRARDWNEVEVPVYANSLGYVLCAYGALRVPPTGFTKLTPHTRTHRQFLTELIEIRRRGYAYAKDELELGLTGLAAPVLGLDGSVIAAIGISGPTARLQENHAELGQMLSEQGARLAALLRTSTPTPKKGAA